MGIISTYGNDYTPQLDDKIIGTSISGPPDDNTANFLLEDILTLFQSQITLQTVTNAGNSITLQSNREKGINIIIPNFQSQYSTGIYVTVDSQTGTNSNSDAFVARINGQNPSSLPFFVGGFSAIVTGADNLSFVSEHRAGTSLSTHYSGMNTLGITSSFAHFLTNDISVFEIDYLGNTTANSFVKEGGTNSEFLKADGSIDSNSYSENSFLDIGDSINPTTTIDLSLAHTTKVNIIGDTTLDFTNQEVGKSYTIIPYIDQPMSGTVLFSSNVKFNGNSTPSILPGNNIDYSFITNTGFNNTVSAIAIQSDGKILLGGAFQTYQGITSNYITRLNSDGSIDTSFVAGTGFGTVVSTIAIQSDGKILVGGSFSTYQGVTYNRIIRLNVDGSIDTSFVVGTGFSAGVSTIAIQSDGKILLGGAFQTYQGITSNRIIRLNVDGSIDTSFVVGTGFNNTVNTIVTQSDGKILVGGSISSYQGVSSSCIIRLNSDGSKDTSFAIGAGFNSAVSVISLQTNGKILVGGDFTNYQAVTYNKIIRLNADASIDTSFVIGTGFNSTITALALQPDGKILVGGAFQTYQGVTLNRIARLNSDGSIDALFFIGTGFGGTTNAIFVQSDEKILVGGGFQTYQGVTSSRIVRLQQIPNPIYYKIDMVSDGTNLIAK